MVDSKRPMAFVEDEDLLDDVLKLAAAAGCDLECVPDAAAARLRWSTAPLVLLDATGAEHCERAGLPRRDAVVLVCAEPASKSLWERAVGIGAERVLELPGAESWLVSVLADATEAPAPTTGRALAVVGGRGGAGASVFVAALGLTALRMSQSALLIDCDALGGGLDLVLGAESEQGLRWPDMHLRAGRVAASSLHDALPSRTRGTTRLTVLSGARKGRAPAPDAVAAVLEAGRRAGETVICDLPRALDDAAQAALTRADLTVVVVPGEVRACVSARLLAERLAELGAKARLVVRGPAPGSLHPDEVAKAVNVPLLTTMRPEPNLSQALDRGDFSPRPRGPLATAARATLAALAAQPLRTNRSLRAAS
ncbi:septum site-determining protein Ssd [Actinophytocola sp.]|uniref:septum site-determining protein Ssd n=1 Tax=Actinophytocola sp. TaxID=1872138 RepID=UPI003D6B7E7D